MLDFLSSWTSTQLRGEILLMMETVQEESPSLISSPKCFVSRMSTVCIAMFITCLYSEGRQFFWKTSGIVLQVSVWTLGSAANSSVTLWNSVLPIAVLPDTLRQLVSPLEDSPIATRFANAVSRGAVFPEVSAEFCNAASLVCDSHVQIASYGLERVEAAPRASAIKTINDFQFDFFLEKNLFVGGEMQLSENLHDPIPARPFLPRVVADSLPSLTTANLPKLRQMFNIADKASMSTMMGTAAYLCENPALPGEDKECPITLAAMAQFVSSQLGSEVEALSTSGSPTEAPHLKAPVKIETVTKRSLTEGYHIIICHTIMFPSALYYCHHVSGTKVVQASLRAQDNSVIHAVGICHLDTSMWASEHPAFTALNIPRGAEACHWSTQNDMVWVSTATQWAIKTILHRLTSVINHRQRSSQLSTYRPWSHSSRFCRGWCALLTRRHLQCLWSSLLISERW